MLLAPHPLDPNLIDFGEDYEHRIYAPNCEDYVIVDAVDYWHFSRYAWNFKSCKANKNYMRRAVAIWIEGVKIRTISLYLHVEIMKRVRPVPPSPAHRKVDHRDGNELNCRRANLRWATDKMNNMNRFGNMPYDLLEEVE